MPRIYSLLMIFWFRICIKFWIICPRNFIRHFTSQSNPKVGSSLVSRKYGFLGSFSTQFLVFFLDRINFSVPLRLTYYDVTLSIYFSSSCVCILRVTDRWCPEMSRCTSGLAPKHYLDSTQLFVYLNIQKLLLLL